MKRRKNAKTPVKRKMSEMISEMAEGFLWVGDTIGERQNRLNAACIAWNMACGSIEVRRKQLEQYRESFLRYILRLLQATWPISSRTWKR